MLKEEDTENPKVVGGDRSLSPGKNPDSNVIVVMAIALILTGIGCWTQAYMDKLDESRMIRIEKYGTQLNLPFDEERARNIVTVFAQGQGAAFHQVTKYVGKDGIDLQNITGKAEPYCTNPYFSQSYCTQWVNIIGGTEEYCKNNFCGTTYRAMPSISKINHAPLLLHNVHVPSKDLSDLECAGHYDDSSVAYECIAKTVGMSCLCDLFEYMVKAPFRYVVRFIMIVKDFFSSSYFDIRNPMQCHQNPRKVNIAGRSDLIDYVERVEQAMEANKDNDKGFVLFGTSRGAALTFMGVTLLRPEILKRIKLIVLEAPFDDLELTLEETYPLFFVPFVKLYLNVFTQCKLEESSPLKRVLEFPTDIPVAFIMTKNDNTVSNIRTKSLRDGVIMYRQAFGAEKGRGTVHSLMLDENRHFEMSVGSNTEDILRYKAFMDDLYVRYL